MATEIIVANDEKNICSTKAFGVTIVQKVPKILALQVIKQTLCKIIKSRKSRKHWLPAHPFKGVATTWQRPKIPKTALQIQQKAGFLLSCIAKTPKTAVFAALEAFFRGG